MFALLAAPLFAEIDSVSALRSLKPEDVHEWESCRFVAQVVHASALRPDTYVVTRNGFPSETGVLVYAPGCTKPAEGDIVLIEGHCIEMMKHAAVKATSIEITRNSPLPQAKEATYYNLRVGYLHARRIYIRGTVANAKTEDGISSFDMKFEDSIAHCRIAGEAPDDGEAVLVTGCAFNIYNESGLLWEPVLEVSNLKDIEPIKDHRETLLYSIIAFLTALLGTAMYLHARMLLKRRQERLSAQAIAAERRRMAADLHDTIEQQLASVKLLVTAAIAQDGCPDATRATLNQAAEVLLHTKSEVRNVILNLRMGEESAKPPQEALEELAREVNASGIVRVRCALKNLPRSLATSRLADLMMIAREAITNAVKHGKAKNIAIVFDNGRIRFLNDGEKFDRSAALGPETGHFGLAGMEERARKSKFSISFVNSGRWCGPEVQL